MVEWVVGVEPGHTVVGPLSSTACYHAAFLFRSKTGWINRLMYERLYNKSLQFLSANINIRWPSPRVLRISVRH